MNTPIKIVFLDSATVGEVNALEKIKELGSYTSYEYTEHKDRIERIKGNHIVITNKVIIDKEVMEACPEIGLICITATGLNNVDLDHAEAKGIPVKNVGGYSTESVAQSTFAMLLYLLNNVRYYDEYVKSGKYSNSPLFTHQGRSFWELKGKQFGIIGLGTIGKRVAEIAQTFGCKVVYFSTSGRNSSTSYPSLSLEELLKTSDVVSIHCPLNENTLNLIGYEQLCQMKNTAILLNAGRGKIVNEADLALALDEDQIAAAGLDVLEYEPIKPDNPLLSLNSSEKLLITPHTAWISREARETLVEGVFSNITAWLKNSN